MRTPRQSEYCLTRRTFLNTSAAAGASVLVGQIGHASEPEPANIGDEPQLFLDEWIIAEKKGLKRTLHQPEKKGLIREADGRPWERGGASSVVRDARGRFHMAYRMFWFDEKALEAKKHFPPEGFRTLTGYAVSDDGIRWEKPVLGLVDGPTGFRRAAKAKWKKGLFWEPTGWSKQNNFGYPISAIRDFGQFGGIGDPSRRYMVFAGGMYYASEVPDVVADPDWRGKLVPIPTASGPRGGIIGWDEKAGIWLAVGQSGGWQGSDQGRFIARWTSKDLISWSGQQIVLPIAEDETRKPDDWVEYYSMGGYRAGDVWLGLLHPYHTDRTNPLYGASHMKNVWMKGTTEVRLMVSRDAGRTWQRVAGKQVWLPRHQEEDGYDRTLYAGSPLRVGDELWIYYRADDGDHITFFKDNTPYYPDRTRIARTALATLRWDGYVSLDAGQSGGRLVTRPLQFKGEKLTVNLDAPQGELKAELQDGAGEPIPGFSAADCLPITGDGLALSVRWRGKGSLAPLAGHTVRVHFDLTRGSLYAFGFV